MNAEDKPGRIITDGSSAEAGAGSAAIIRFRGLPPLKLTAVLGQADPVEAELFAVIMGIAAARACSATELFCLCDSEAVVLGAAVHLSDWRERGWRTSSGAEVRHVGLWRIFEAITRQSALVIRAPASAGEKRAHSACDKASRWASRQGVVLLERHGETKIGRVAAIRPEFAWHLLDARDVVKRARENADAAETAGILQAGLSRFCPGGAS